MKDLDLYKSQSQSDTHIQRHFRNLQQSARPISSAHKPITNRLFYVTAAGPALCIRCQKCLNISESHIQRHFRQPNWHLKVPSIAANQSLGVDRPPLEKVKEVCLDMSLSQSHTHIVRHFQHLKQKASSLFKVSNGG